MKRVAVIGAGASGLCALRHLQVRSDYSCICYEATNHIGGTWKYTETIDEPEHTGQVHGAMYQNLVTNLPKEVMYFPCMEFDPNLPSFIAHHEVQAYLEQYAERFNLHKYIKFNHYVRQVSRIENVWLVETMHNSHASVAQFDAIFVCNGHYAKPCVPIIEGVEVFQGSVEHSRNYRRPDKYKDRTVLLLGARPSGQDISIDIAKVAKRVILSHRNCPLSTSFPENVHQRFGIVKFTRNGVIFQDGVEEPKVDNVILCTGYEYLMPFLDESCGICVQEYRLTPLYKHIVNVSNPTMYFIGLCAIICPFQHFDVQVRYCISWLDDNFPKPDTEAMLAWIEHDYKHKTVTLGWKDKYAHVLHDLQWPYVEELASEARIDGILPVVKKIYDHVTENRTDNVLTYRSAEFRIINEHEYSYCGPFSVQTG